jgi:hypothetical protein
MNLAGGEKLAEIKGDESAALVGANDEGLETAVKAHERGKLSRVRLEGAGGDESRHMVGGVETPIARAGVDAADVAGIPMEDAGKEGTGEVHVNHRRGRRLPHVFQWLAQEW